MSPRTLAQLCQSAWQDHDQQVRPALEAALPGLRTRGDSVGVARASLGLAALAIHRSEPERCVQLLDQGIAALDPDEDLELWTRLLSFRGYMFLNDGALFEALEPMTTLIRRCQGVEARRAEVLRARGNLASALMRLGDLEGAESILRDGLRDAVPSMTIEQLHSLHNLTIIAYLRGDRAALVEAEQQMPAPAQRCHRPQFAAHLLNISASLHSLMDGQWAAAQEAAQRSLDTQAPWMEGHERAVAAYLCAAAAMGAGDIDGAERSARAARAALGLLPSAFRRPLLRLCATIARTRGDIEQMASLLDEVLRDQEEASLAPSYRKRLRRYLEAEDLQKAELKEKNAALQRARDIAESASAERQRFLATMSHELRTPLHGVIGTAELLAAMPLPAAAHQLVEIIRDSGALTIGIVDDILDFRKLEEGRLVLDTVAFPLRARLDAVLHLLQARAASNQTSLALRLHDELPAVVHGDDHRLQQVLLNLIENAIKFTPGGTVTLTVRPATGGMLHFAIVDDGAGIPADMLPKLFSPYTQADAAISRRVGGTGLGLAICKQLVSLAGGQIGAESTEGVGSTFWFTMVLPPAEAHHTAPRAPQNADGMRILLADDHAINRMLIRQMLRSLGARVETAEDGREAVAVALRTQPDLILMDLHMPELGGDAATQRLRALGYTGAILALTASVLEEDRRVCEAAGMDGFVTKPVTQASFFEALALLEQSRGA